MKYNRLFLIVLDSFGIGNAPDAEKFDDVGADTLESISKSDKFNISNLKKLGLANIDCVNYKSCQTVRIQQSVILKLQVLFQINLCPHILTDFPMK